MTYNTRSCRGLDGRVDIDRVARVVRGFAPDLLLLQEVDVAEAGNGGVDQARVLASELGMVSHFTCAFSRESGHYGIAMLASNKLSREKRNTSSFP